MVARYHTGAAITTCPVCGKHMKVGSRVKVQLSWEMDDRLKFASVGCFVCHRCAEGLAKASTLEVPDQIAPYL